MDPNETLKDMRAIASTGVEGFGGVESLIALSRLFQDLDERLSKGDFLPSAWTAHRASGPWNGPDAKRLNTRERGT